MTEPTAKAPPQRENIWLNLLCNIVVPSLILSKFSAEDRLGPAGALIIGILFPLGYGIYDLVVRRKWNVFSIVGFLSVGLTGGLGLMKIGSLGFAVKEATVPAIFGIAVLATLRTKKPLVREMLLNESVIDVPKIDAALAARGTRAAFERLLLNSTRLLALTFAGSAVINFVLARLILRSPGGTPEFTAELGRMTWISYLVIMAPMMAMLIIIMWRLFAGLQRLTGLSLEEVMHPPPKKAGRTNAVPEK